MLIYVNGYFSLFDPQDDLVASLLDLPSFEDRENWIKKA
jgi:hypothetical protein